MNVFFATIVRGGFSQFYNKMINVKVCRKLWINVQARAVVFF